MTAHRELNFPSRLSQDNDFPGEFIICVSPFLEKGCYSGHLFFFSFSASKRMPQQHALKMLWLE